MLHPNSQKRQLNYKNMTLGETKHFKSRSDQCFEREKNVLNLAIMYKQTRTIS